MRYRSEPLVRPPRALLVCLAESSFSGAAPSAQGLRELEDNGAILVREWEKAEMPALFVERPPTERSEPFLSMSAARGGKDDARENAGGAGISGRRRRPRLGDFVLRSDSPSLLRHRRFNRLFEDLGGPLLILFGDALGDAVLQTAIDGFLSGHPIIIVKDAAPRGLEDSDMTLSMRSTALALLSCFTRLMTTAELLSEWTIS